MTDPLAELVTLLEPSISYSKLVVGAGPWRVSRSEVRQPFYCAILEGQCCLAVEGQPAMMLQAEDFVLIPAAQDFVLSSVEPAAPSSMESVPIERRPGEFHLGSMDVPASLQMVVGHCAFASPDTDLLISLLPQVLHLRGQRRLAALVQWVREEFQEVRPARETVLARLLEMLFIEALRSTVLNPGAQGFLRGLGDERVALALRLMHETPAHAWSVEELARQAALSRSGFFERFSRAMGTSPMAYLLTWRMALARQLLRQRGVSVAEIALRIGYGSASAFTVAFTRHNGCTPGRFGKGVQT